MDHKSRSRACLLGGAVGDALGGAVEFMSLDQIQQRHGIAGIRDYAKAYGRLGAITDDTQMTLFTAEGLIRGLVRLRVQGITDYAGVTANAYLRWLLTQGDYNRHALDPCTPEPGWLFSNTELHAQRAPGITCQQALRAMIELGSPAQNSSKGCGGVMRVAPAGLFAESVEEAFALGCELAALTHGHPTGWLTGGAFAIMIARLREGVALAAAVGEAFLYLERCADHAETTNALRKALELAGSTMNAQAAIKELGEGWIAEEALAIGTYCALVAPDFREGVVMAVNHDGDSDSTGAIAGNLLGLMGGEQYIPCEWLDSLELRDVITELADDLHDCKEWSIGEGAEESRLEELIWQKYPGY